MNSLSPPGAAPRAPAHKTTDETAHETAAVAAATVTVPIVEEQAFVSKQKVDDERVRVTTHTDLIEERVRETLATDEVKVERVAVDRTLAAGEVAPAVRVEGNTTIIPVLEEVVVVEKRLVLKEEIHILCSTTSETVDVPVTLRKQRAVIERSSADGHVIEHDEGGHNGLT